MVSLATPKTKLIEALLHERRTLASRMEESPHRGGGADDFIQFMRYNSRKSLHNRSALSKDKLSHPALMKDPSTLSLDRSSNISSRVNLLGSVKLPHIGVTAVTNEPLVHDSYSRASRYTSVGGGLAVSEVCSRIHDRGSVV